MRRLFLSLLSASCLTVLAMGCRHVCGVCDCEGPMDPCCTRAPWCSNCNGGGCGCGSHGTGPGIPVVAPTSTADLPNALPPVPPNRGL